MMRYYIYLRRVFLRTYFITFLFHIKMQTETWFKHWIKSSSNIPTSKQSELFSSWFNLIWFSWKKYERNDLLVCAPKPRLFLTNAQSLSSSQSYLPSLCLGMTKSSTTHPFTPLIWFVWVNLYSSQLSRPFSISSSRSKVATLNFLHLLSLPLSFSMPWKTNSSEFLLGVPADV